MENLSIEVVMKICSFLPIPDLLSAQVVSRSFQAASTPSLYKQASISDLTGPTLVDTLNQQPSLRCQVKAIELGSDFTFRGGYPGDPLDTVMLPLITHCTSLCSLKICWMDAVNAIEAEFFDSLVNLPAITELAWSSMPARVPLKRLLPALTVWAPRLQSLSLSGVFEVLTTEEEPMEQLEMPYLSHLALGTVEILDEHFIGLFGRMERLQTVDLALMVANAPSDEAVYRALSRTGSTITELKLEKAWTGEGKEVAQLGQDVVRSCQAGVLKSLILNGATMNAGLFRLPQLMQLQELELTVFTGLQATLFRDILEWMQGKPVKLRKLLAYIVDYEQNMDTSAQEALRVHVEGRGIEFDSGAIFGPWRPPLAPVSRRISFGQLDT